MKAKELADLIEENREEAFLEGFNTGYAEGKVSGYERGLEKGQRLGLLKAVKTKSDRIRELESENEALNDELERTLEQVDGLQNQVESYKEVLFFDVE